jgi:hypothetical protein
VRLTHNINPVGPHQIIDFDSVVTNIGGGYNPHGGLFTAHVSGVYLFAVTIETIPGHYVNVAIVKNGEELCLAHGSGADYGSGVCVVTDHLAETDDVWVKHHSGDAIYGAAFPIFTGHLIQADE